jgi:hypothetical protein
MEELSQNARRFLACLYDEKDPTRRTESSICSTLALNKADGEAVLKELRQRNLVMSDGEWWIKLTAAGIDTVEHIRRPPRRPLKNPLVGVACTLKTESDSFR